MLEFKLNETFRMSPEEFIDNIFDASKWPDFEGYGPLPGVKAATISNFSEERVGTKFHITNTDDSKHLETVTEYIPEKLLVLQFSEFTGQPAKYVTHFVESFRFERRDNKTYLERSFQIFPRNFTGKILFSILAIFLKKAIRKHLDKIVEQEQSHL